MQTRQAGFYLRDFHLKRKPMATAPFSATPYISKSKFLWGLQCSKLIWHAYNARHLIPEPDASQQAIFDQGHEVGALAKKMFPDGLEIQGVDDFDKILAQSRQTLKQRK